MFYTALGHFDETWRDEHFQRFLLEALLWITHPVGGDAAPRNPDAPAIAPQAVGNSATLRPPMVISAGSWFTIFATNLTAGSVVTADPHSPLDKLAGTVVKVNGGGGALVLCFSIADQYLPLDTTTRPCSPPTGMADCREGEFEVTVSVAGGDPFHTVSFPLTAADATAGVLISTLQDGYLTIWATGLGAVVASGRSKSLRQFP